ncbi:MAG: hypothetical protein COV07_01455, partial [Candidatus Vogelbacteria bacterium CG10_big_fil_rev_8_21_14_0_10_45_14]
MSERKETQAPRDMAGDTTVHPKSRGGFGRPRFVKEERRVGDVAAVAGEIIDREYDERLSHSDVVLEAETSPLNQKGVDVIRTASELRVTKNLAHKIETRNEQREQRRQAAENARRRLEAFQRRDEDERSEARRTMPEEVRHAERFLIEKPELMSRALRTAALLEILHEYANAMAVASGQGWDEPNITDILEIDGEAGYILRQVLVPAAHSVGMEVIPRAKAVVMNAEIRKLREEASKKMGLFARAKYVVMNKGEVDSRIINETLDAIAQLEAINRRKSVLEETFSKKMAETEQLRADALAKYDRLEKEGQVEKARLIAEGEKDAMELRNKELSDIAKQSAELVDKQQEILADIKKARDDMLTDARMEQAGLVNRSARIEDEISELARERDKLRREVDEMKAMAGRLKGEEPLAIDLLRKLEAEKRERKARDLREVISFQMKAIDRRMVSSEKLPSGVTVSTMRKGDFFRADSFQMVREWCDNLAQFAESAPSEILAIVLRKWAQRDDDGTAAWGIRQAPHSQWQYVQHLKNVYDSFILTPEGYHYTKIYIPTAIILTAAPVDKPREEIVAYFTRASLEMGKFADYLREEEAKRKEAGLEKEGE